MDDIKLIKHAKSAMEFAYVKYSNFKVGAAILTNDGRLFTGCNIENASYGATICAERTAIAKAVSEGYTEFAKIAVVSSAGEPAYPCGICRQVIMEFAPACDMIFEDKDGRVFTLNASELLPYAFEL